MLLSVMFYILYICNITLLFPVITTYLILQLLLLLLLLIADIIIKINNSGNESSITTFTFGFECINSFLKLQF